jgi:mRNA interferase RelE/StbE
VRLELTNRAAKDLDKLERAQPGQWVRVIAKIKVLADDPRLGKPLVGPLKGKWSLRVGEYRIIYELRSNAVVVLTVHHRKDVYR